MKIWQQNLDRGLENQHELINVLLEEGCQFVVLQEPYIGPGAWTRADAQWRVVYPTPHGKEGVRSRAVTLVNVSLPTDSWNQMQIDSPDMVAVEFRGEFGTLRMVNIYNDGDHDETLRTLRDFMREAQRRRPPTGEAEAARAVAPLLQLLGHYSMKMPLPQGVPTLRAKRTGNLTRPDNVFCSDNFFDFFISCDAYPTRTPGTTDHFPIISVVDLVPPVRVKETRWDWRGTNWEEFKELLAGELDAIGEVDGYASVNEILDAIQALDKVVWRCVEEKVPKLKSCARSKRWWTSELSALRRDKERLARLSYHQREVPGSPAHEEYRVARNYFSSRVRAARRQHWLEWLDSIDGADVWTAGQLMKGGSTDGGRTRVPDLRRKSAGGGEEVAATNSAKSKWMVEEFYPKRGAGATDPPGDTVYPEPLWEYSPISEALLHQAVGKMKPWKATRSGTFPNCLYKYCAASLVPRLCKIYRALDVYQHEPEDWKRTETIIARKPGKPDYSLVGAHRPLILSHGHARLRNAAKTIQVTTNAERYNMLPANHYGGRPGRTGVDMVQVLVKRIKDTWRKGKVATLLLRDVKGAFPSAMISRVVHNMRMAGVPKGHTDWMERRFEGRTTQLLFDDYISEPFPIDDGLDQGDPQSVICYLFYNSPLARVHDDSGIYIDDYHVLAVGNTLVETSGMVAEIVTKDGGVNEWGVTHNSVFGAAKDQACHFSQRKVLRRRPFGQKSVWEPERRPNLVINGHVVKPSKAVKLVGIWLDEKLTFKEQAAAAVAKGQEWIVNFRRLGRVAGGVAAAYIRQLYISICVPRMLYGAEVWLAPTYQRDLGANRRRDTRAPVKKLASIQLRAARLMLGGMVSSPGDLLDAHADLLPMNLAVDKILQKAAVRYATLPPTHPLHAAVANVARYGHVKKHPSPLHFLMTAYKNVRQDLVEKIPAARMEVMPVQVRVATSKEEAKEWAMAETARVSLFSDGSLIDGQVGAAGLLCVDGAVKRVKGVRLGTAKKYGVYEAEGVGQILALECLRLEVDEWIDGIVPLGLDNTAAIRATTCSRPGVGRHLWDLFHRRLAAAKEEHPGLRLRVDWTPGHVEIPGNEAADEAAKRAAKNGSFGGTPVFLKNLPYSKSALVLAHTKVLKKAARKQFTRSRRYGRTRSIDDSMPSSNFRKLTKGLPRKHASLLFQLRSHHAPLAKHLFRLNKSPTPTCPCCGLYEETVDHYLHFCTAHDAARRQLRAANRLAAHSKHLLSDPKLLPDLFLYVQRTGRFHSVFGDFKLLERPKDK
ncbi:RNA-directed DNA polymerase from transposon X-element [Mycena sanguinolenta]|uniref:RNA-directed DNA polymerase from transposon X-element n=1 Tax=Mycena sanguinolenta TaxID=230812 RepID=A0A8H6Z9E1_9AGAR|nr:RNA-directed DNA polymerase from transposon X-element [Mycena sanguinolenta]